MFFNKTYFTFLLYLSGLAVHAQYTDVINSNRPGISQSAFSVGTNVLQFEAGPYTVKEAHTPLKYNVSGFGVNAAARYGLFLPQLELNVQTNYQSDTKTDNRSQIADNDKRANFKSLILGAKYLVYDPYKNNEEKPNLYSFYSNKKFKWKSLIPAVAVFVGANFDFAKNPFTAPGVEGFSPKATIITQNNFSSGWVFVMNFTLDRIGTDYSDFEYILTMTKAINPNWVLFGETQGIKSDFYADNLFRFGGAYLWSKNFQLDTALTFNAKDTPSVLSVNLGVSYRFDMHKDKNQNGDSAEEEAERRTNKRRKKKKKKKELKEIEGENGGSKRKKETQVIDFGED